MGGMNTKVSLYANGPAEFRDLSNLNFVNTGALTKRPGTTLFAGITLPSIPNITRLTSGYEYTKLDGSSFLVICAEDQIFQYYATFILNPIPFLQAGNPLVTKANSLFSFVTFVDRLFACDGDSFFRLAPYAGISSLLNAFLYSLPQDINFFAFGGSTSYISSMSFTGLAANATSGLSGNFVLGYAFVNDRGFIGPVSAGITVSAATLGSTRAVKIIVGYCDRLTSYYGVTAIQLYRSEVDGVVLTALPTLSPITFSGSTCFVYDVGSSLLLNSPVASQDFYMPNIGGSFIFSAVATPIPPFIPRYLEVFNNQLFMAGFTLAPSSLWWSDIGEPEGVQPQSSAETRTNDGDIITGLKSYFGSLVITKRKSVHILSGDNPDNFLIQELTDQYGCVSHRAIVPWNNVLWFLDSKGIMEYNGANIRCVSDKIEPIFNNMNLLSAYDNACGIHVKKFNEVWFNIPANGSTINNQILVYDYVADAWTHYDGIQSQCLFNAFAGFPKMMPFAGNYTGGLVYFDSTLTSDNDSGITCSFDSIFFAARGQTTENMYRRFYLNMDPIIGFTQGITLTFKTNFGNTVQLTRSMYQNPYQSRIDFGLSARSLQASMYHYSASLSLKINGFTIESRYQRSV